MVCGRRHGSNRGYPDHFHRYMYILHVVTCKTPRIVVGGQQLKSGSAVSTTADTPATYSKAAKNPPADVIPDAGQQWLNGRHH